MWIVRLIVIMALVGGLIIFAFNNARPNQVVDVNLQPFYANYTDVPLLTVVGGAIVGGMIIGLILFGLMYVRQSVSLHDASRRVKALENEVAILRNRPIDEVADLMSGSDSRKAESRSLFDEV